MSPLLALRLTNTLRPGRMLDVGCRDFFISGQFAEAGYKVHAIDPNPLEGVAPPDGVTFEKTTLEQYAGETPFDLVVASFVSQFVSLSLAEFLCRLSELCKPDGLIYMTLIGDQDAWATNPKIRAVTVDEANALVAQVGLKPVFHSVSWFEGATYDGAPKYWHVYQYLLAKA